jgi:hypothetical protein
MVFEVVLLFSYEFSIILIIQYQSKEVGFEKIMRVYQWVSATSGRFWSNCAKNWKKDVIDLCARGHKSG